MGQKKYKRVADISKKVPNVLSQKIAAASDGEGNAGLHEVTFTLPNLPLKPVYICPGKGFSEPKKDVLAR